MFGLILSSVEDLLFSNCFGYPLVDIMVLG